MSDLYVAAPSRGPSPGLFSDADYARQRAFFDARPDLRPTPLRRLPGLARLLGLRAIWAKDETGRFGLTAFKAAGARFAVETLLEEGAIAPGATLACASEGNHGRAVARAAREAGCACRVYMAATAAAARVAAIEDEGATVVRVQGTYDDAVGQAAHEARAHGWTVVSDTSWPGYEDIPRRIMLGYTRLMDEAADAWGPGPDTIFVQGGVGGLLAAVASWTAWRYGQARPAIVSVEPSSAACLLESARAGAPVHVHGPLTTVMAGLRCGDVSPLAFSALRPIVDAYMAIDDDWAVEGLRRLARPSGGDRAIEAGASGAAALGGLLAALHDPEMAEVKARLGLGPGSRVAVLVTEGVTDPAIWDALLG
ncbi:MAG: diaminopropionate ammonia-lyase [Vicinamibacterales bacterium]